MIMASGRKPEQVRRLREYNSNHLRDSANDGGASSPQLCWENNNAEINRVPRHTQPQGRSKLTAGEKKLIKIIFGMLRGTSSECCQFDLAVKILFILFHKDSHTAPPPIETGLHDLLTIYNQGHNQSQCLLCMFNAALKKTGIKIHPVYFRKSPILCCSD